MGTYPNSDLKDIISGKGVAATLVRGLPWNPAGATPPAVVGSTTGEHIGGRGQRGGTPLREGIPRIEYCYLLRLLPRKIGKLDCTGITELVETVFSLIIVISFASFAGCLKITMDTRESLPHPCLLVSHW